MNENKIIIFDTTLRDGEQALASSLSMEQKLRIAKQLARLNVDVIEAGFPVSSPGDFESVSTISKEVRGPAVCGLARAVEKDITACGEALKGAKRPRIHTFIGTSQIHTEKKLRKSEDDILQLVKKSVEFARNYTDDVEFSAEDAGRTGKDFLCRVVETAIKAGAGTINIPDTVGYTVPEHFASIMDLIFERVPNVGDAVISVHCHDDLGMSTANSLTAIAHGARQVECTINGIGERAGNAALEEIVMALKVRKDLFNVYTDIETSELMRTSKLIRDICNMPVQPNKAIVGSNAFAHSSGIHQDGVLKAKTTYEIMTPQSVGLKDNKMNLTSRSGSHMVKSRLASLGYEEADYTLSDFYTKFKNLADKKGTVYDDDLITLMESKSSEDLEDRYVLDYLNVSSGKKTVPTATARIVIDGEVKQEAACGDGAVDAATKAIDRIVGFDIEIEGYHLDSVTQGREALGRVAITASAPEGHFVGNGTSTDIVEASAFAYMDIINKIARMKMFNKKIPPKIDISL
ncbi:2-isopropylmalate synthase [Chitinispirillales bacterium ANBcel5]|uniref:2-isopropylmalate synthase n=1 Tax=Cellulosispirillum alkaliphilum TaxID=3039283 RepID=UPI002A5579A7|nr:2-isopropylmalate synthase [Chitinispirillales bacterium ANBcel5]